MYNTKFKENKRIEELLKKDWLSLKEDEKKEIKTYKKLNKVRKKSVKEIYKPTKLELMKDKLIRGKKFLSLDLEFYEEFKTITEVGITLYNKEKNEIESYHYIVKENKDLLNGKYVPNKKFDFNLGESQILLLKDIYKEVYKKTKDVDFFIGHDFGNDINFLKECNYKEDISILDTQEYTKYIFEEQRKMNLETLCKNLNLNCNNLHNAGNDSYWTLKALLEISKKEEIKK